MSRFPGDDEAEFLYDGFEESYEPPDDPDDDGVVLNFEGLRKETL